MAMNMTVGFQPTSFEPTDPLTRQHGVTHEKVVRNLFMGQLLCSLS